MVFCPTHLRSTPIVGVDTQGSGSKDPELKKHLEAAKRAASALFSGNLISIECVCVCMCVCVCECISIYLQTIHINLDTVC